MPKPRTLSTSVIALVTIGCGDAAEPAIVLVSGLEARTCALFNTGELFCWGRVFTAPYDRYDETPVRFGNDLWASVSVGTTHACGIKHDGTLWCWGRNCAGQLASGTRDDRDEPVHVGAADNWRRVGVGGGHSCAIDDAGALFCWGGPDYGQSDCSATPSLPVTRIDGEWTDASAHFYSVNALAADGSLWLMADQGGHLDPSGGFGALEPIAAGTKWKSISTGIHDLSACGVTDGSSLACVLGSTPVPVGSGWDYAGPIAVRDHGCAIRYDGSLWCWGRNDMGQCGQGTKEPAQLDEPTRVGTETDWTSISTGWSMSCGLRAGTVYCWGDSAGGVLGRSGLEGTGIHPPSPVEL